MTTFACAGVVACLPSARFRCAEDDVCTHGENGRCESSGYCSYDVDDCPGGRAYSPLAGDNLGSACLDPIEVTSTTQTSVGTATTTLGPPTQTATTASSTTATTSGSDSTSSSDSTENPAQWWDCDFGVRRRVQVTNPTDESLEQFTVLLRFDPAAAEFADDGADIRFVDDAGNELTYEIESFEPGLSASVWVRVPQLADDAELTFWMYASNPAAPPAEFDQAAWDDDYVAVWHLGELKGSTDNAVGLNENGDVGTAQGIAGLAKTFTSEAAMVAEDQDALVDIFAAGGTVSAWVKPDDGWVGDLRVVSKTQTDVGHAGWSLELDDDGESARALSFQRNNLGGHTRWFGNANAIARQGRWQHVAATFDDSTGVAPSLYVDGAPQIELGPPSIGGLFGDAPHPVRIGRGPGTGETFQGAIDEVRLSRTIRSEAWLAAEFEAGLGNMTTLGQAELSPCGTR